MGTRKTDLRAFNDFEGADYTNSLIGMSKKAAIECKNLERLPTGDLRARNGYKIEAQPLYHQDIFNHVYVDENGTVQEEILCLGGRNFSDTDASSTAHGRMNGHLFRLKKRTGTLTITDSHANAWFISFLPNDSAGNFTFSIYESGSPVLEYDVGTGEFDDSNNKTLKQLCDTIDALSDYSCTCPATAVVNGNQSGVTTVTVDSGFDSGIEQEWVEFDSSLGGVEYAQVVATASTTITMGGIDSPSRDYDDNDVIGHGRYPAAILELYQSDNDTSTKTISYSYWEPIYCPLFMLSSVDTGYGDYPFIDLEEDFGKEEHRYAGITNSNNCAYFTAAYAQKLDLTKLINDADPVNFEGGTWKYDGTSVYLSGPVNLVEDVGTTSNFMTTAESASGTAMPAGDYKYQISILRQDARDNISESFIEYILTQTQTATKDVDITIGDASGGLGIFGQEFFNIKTTASTTTDASAVTEFDVTSGHKLRTGDWIWFEDNSNDVQKRKITDWTNTTITINESATITSGNVISTALVRIWRTKEDGNEFFLAQEEVMDVDLGGASFAVTDDTTDANLGIKLNSVKQESIQYNFPRCNAIVEHQGTLVAAGGPSIQNSVVWEDALYFESVDYARTISEVPTMNSGGINGLMAQDNSSLLITKCGALYEALGSFSTNNVEITRIVENSYGAKSPSALTVLEDFIFGACELGLWGMGRNRQIDFTFGERILTYFDALDALSVDIDPNRIRLHYDSSKKQLHVVLPSLQSGATGEGSSDFTHYYPFISSSGRYLVFQLPQKANQPVFISRHETQPFLYPTSGIINHAGDQYMGAHFYDSSPNEGWSGHLMKRLDYEVFKTSGGGYIGTAYQKYDFIDNNTGYTAELTPAWEDLESPDYDKVWHEFSLYIMQSDYLVTAFDINFEAYRDWSTASGYTDTTRTLSFSAVSGYQEQSITFDKQYRARARTFKMDSAVFQTAPFFSGYTYTVDERAFKRDKTGRDR